jgi:plastocyanin
MFARRRPLPPRAFALAAISALLALGSLLALTTVAPRSRAAAEPAQATVTITNYTFSPAVLTVAPGTTVRWVNLDRDQHDVTGVMNASTLKSPPLSQNDTFEFTFSRPGTYNYICSFHPSMTGQVQVSGDADSFTFPETGFMVRGAFWNYWRTRGLEYGDYDVSYRESLGLFGYPISGEMQERLEDGKTYTVQYFERARLELHPENADPAFQVLLGQFGRRIHPADPPAPAQANPGAIYFNETGHNLSGRFRGYWEENGGLAIFGYPLSEPFTEVLEDGKPYTVQYFERARLELHPENAPPYDVLLGQFGRRILNTK